MGGARGGQAPGQAPGSAPPVVLHTLYENARVTGGRRDLQHDARPRYFSANTYSALPTAIATCCLPSLK